MVWLFYLLVFLWFYLLSVGLGCLFSVLVFAVGDFLLVGGSVGRCFGFV